VEAVAVDSSSERNTNIVAMVKVQADCDIRYVVGRVSMTK
jgi:hypothetical protein